MLGRNGGRTHRHESIVVQVLQDFYDDPIVFTPIEDIADLGGILRNVLETVNSLPQGKRTITQPEDTASLFPLDLAQWRWWFGHGGRGSK